MWRLRSNHGTDMSEKVPGFSDACAMTV